MFCVLFFLRQPPAAARKTSIAPPTPATPTSVALSAPATPQAPTTPGPSPADTLQGKKDEPEPKPKPKRQAKAKGQPKDTQKARLWNEDKVIHSMWLRAVQDM